MCASRSGLWYALPCVLFFPTVSTAGPTETLAGYQKWLDAQKVITLSAKTETIVLGASPYQGMMLNRCVENVTRDGDDWGIGLTRELLDPDKRKLRPKEVVEMKVGPSGVLVVPRNADGTVKHNVIADPKATAGRVARSLSDEVGFLFGYATNAPLTVIDALKRGEMTESSIAVAGRPAIRIRSIGKYGSCELTVDPHRGFAPLRFRWTIKAGDSVAAGKKTLGELSPMRSPYYPQEKRTSIDTIFEIAEFTPTEPARPTRWQGIKTTTFESGKVVVVTSRTSATYPSIPATSPTTAQVPAGTRAVVTGDKSGVEYQWDGQKAVPAHDPTAGNRLKRVAFANPWLPWVVGATAVLIGSGLGLYWLRRRRS